MPDFQPIFRSPIDPANFPPQNPTVLLTLVDLTGAPVVLVQGQAEARLQKQFGRVPAKPGDLVEVGEDIAMLVEIADAQARAHAHRAG